MFRSSTLAAILSPATWRSLIPDGDSKRGAMLRRVGNAAVATLSAQGIAVLYNLLLVPVFLRYWSVLVYGEWLALSSLAAYLSTVDIGVSIFGVNKLTQAYAQGDMREYRLYQSTFLSFYLVVASVGTLVLAILAWALPLGDWLGLRATPSHESSWVIFLLGIQVLWSIPQRFMISIYRTVGDMAKTQWIMNAQMILMMSLIALGLALGAGMVQLAVLQIISVVTVGVWVLQDVRRHLNDVFPSIVGASAALFREAIKPSLLFAVFVLTTPMVFQGTVILVSVVLGGAAVAVFATTRTLVNLVRQVIGAISYAIWPELTMIEARGETRHLAGMLRLTVTLSIIISVAFAATLWFEGADVLRIWTHGRLEPDLLLLRVFLIETVLVVIVQTAGGPAVASNRHQVVSKVVLIASILGFILSAWLIKPLGLVGVPLGLLIGEAIAMYHYVVADACRISGIAYGPFARYLWGGILAVGLPTFVADWFAHNHLAAIPYLVRWAAVGLTTSVTALSLGGALVVLQYRGAKLIRSRI